MLVVADRVKEYTDVQGTGPIPLLGADSTFLSFAEVCSIGDTVNYCVASQSSDEWEIGVGTYTAGNVLVRNTVLASSTGTFVNFTASGKEVYITVPAESIKDLMRKVETYEHSQMVPSDEWTITHNLGKYPSVSIIDSGGTVVFGNVTYNNNNQITLRFSFEHSGKAYLN